MSFTPNILHSGGMAPSFTHSATCFLSPLIVRFDRVQAASFLIRNSPCGVGTLYNNDFTVIYYIYIITFLSIIYFEY